MKSSSIHDRTINAQDPAQWAGRSVSYGDEAVMSAFLTSLHARKNVLLEEIAQHIVESSPPSRIHTIRLVDQFAFPDEVVIGTIDLTAAGTPIFEIQTAPAGPRIATWGSKGEKPTVRPGVMDIFVVVSGVEQRRREAAAALAHATLLMATVE